MTGLKRRPATWRALWARLKQDDDLWEARMTSALAAAQETARLEQEAEEHEALDAEREEALLVALDDRDEAQADAEYWRNLYEQSEGKGR